MRGGLMIWIGAFVFLVGFIALIIGARLSSIVENGIKSGVEKEVVVTEASAQDSDFMTVVQPYSFFLYNVTNAASVVVNGSKPIVDEIEVKFSRTQQKYDFTVTESTYGYREYSTYTPLIPSEYNMSLITLNPVYLAAAIGQGQQELGFQSSLTPAVLRRMVPNLLGPSGFLSLYQRTVIPVYLLTLLAQCVELPFVPLNGSHANCIQQWGLQDQLEGKRIADENSTVIHFTGWELPAPISLTVASALWGSDNNASLINATGAGRWAALGVLAAQVAAGNTSAIPLYNASLHSLIGDLPSLDEAQAQIVIQYLAKQLTPGTIQHDKYYFDVIRSSLVGVFPMAADAKVWEDLGLLQWSGGLLTQSLDKNNSILTPIFEFYAWQVDVAGEIPVNLTLNETRNFLEYFRREGTVAQLFSDVMHGVAGSELEQKYGWLGIKNDTLPVIERYLFEYLPTTYVFKLQLFMDKVLEDGTHPSNTGMFVRRSVREIMHGYDDALLTVLGQNQTWTGLVGPEIRDIEEARAFDTFRNKTGKLNVFQRTNLDILDDWSQWEGLSEFKLATDLGARCPAAVWAQDSEAANCTVWQHPEVVQGKHHHLQFAPFQEDNKPTSFNVFAPTLYRNIWFDYAGDVKVQDITMRRFMLRPSELKTVEENINSTQAAERSRNYRITTSGFQDLSTASAMTPLYLGLPRHYGNLAEQEKISGLTPQDWNDTSNRGALETFLDIEPVTGKVMQARQRLQINFRLDSRAINSFYAKMYLAQSFVMFPVLWGQEGDTISHADAAKFRESVYDSRSLAKSWTVVLIIFGMILMVLGLGAACKGWRVYRIKDANEHMPLRPSDRKAFL